MADFSIKSTNIGPTANAVAVQDTPVDPSLATAVGVAGRTAIQGAEIYKKYKTNQFEKEYDDYTEVGLGLKDPETPEEKSFRKTVERLNQIEGMGTPNSVSVAREVHLRQAMRDHPFLADSYMAAAGKSERKYSSIFKAIGDLEAQRAADAKAKAEESDKWLKNKVDRLESMGTKYKYAPSDGEGNFMSWEDLIDKPELLNWNEVQLYLKQGSAESLEMAQLERTIRRENEADARARGRESRAIVEFNQKQITYASGQVAQGKVAEFANALDRSLKKIAYSGMPEAQQAQAVAEVATESARRLENELVQMNASGEIDLSRQQISDSGDQLKSIITDMRELYTGDFSDVKTRERHLTQLEQGVKIDALTKLRLLSVINATGARTDAIAIQALVGALKQGSGPASVNAMSQEIIKLMEQQTNNPESQRNLPPNTEPVGAFIRNISANQLMAASRPGTETYNNFVATPGAYASAVMPTVAAYMEEGNPGNKEKLYNAIMSDTTFQAIEAATPEQKQVALEGVQQALQYRIQSLPSPKVLSGMLDFDTDAEEFIPTDPQAAGYARLMNQTFRYALQTEAAAGNISDIDTVSRKYFRIAIEPVEGEDGWNN
jgi:hypothetical protein